MMNHLPTCPRCRTSLDEGPVMYRCVRCRRAVPAADLDTEYHAPVRAAA
jgi:tRNA(Ile2) C34 agmatinyltransferase TiaS